MHVTIAEAALAGAAITALGSGGYRPLEAHRRATGRRARHHQRRIDTCPELGQIVGELLVQRWSPQQISRQLRRRFPGEPGMWLCHESIYQAVYQPGSPLSRPSPLAPHRRSPLHTGRDHRRAHQHADRRRPRFEQPMVTLGQRPFQPDDRSQAGHWEGDLERHEAPSNRAEVEGLRRCAVAAA